VTLLKEDNLPYYHLALWDTYTTLQELATRISHRNTGAFTRDPLIEKLTARIAIDENLHYVFYRELAKAALEVDPSAMVQAIRR
jgi:acyl-[acyl-carrier protein] desaturase